MSALEGEGCDRQRVSPIAQVIEAVTRTSTERKEPVRSLREAVRLAGIEESRAYRALRRADRHGFRLGLSLDLSRADAGLAGEWYPEAEKYAASVVGELVAVERRMAVIVESGTCRLDAPVWRTKLILLSRPALASSCYPLSQPPTNLKAATIEAMRRAFYTALSDDSGYALMVRRKASIDLVGLSILLNLALDARLPVSRVAQALGLNERSMQRRIRSLWRKGVILGYGVLDAPYMTRGMIVKAFKHRDMYKLAFSATVMPPVAYASVVEIGKRQYAALGIRAPRPVADQVAKIIEEAGGSLAFTRVYSRVRLAEPFMVLGPCSQSSAP